MIYDPKAAPGSRWTQDGLPESTVSRMYHRCAYILRFPTKTYVWLALHFSCLTVCFTLFLVSLTHYWSDVTGSVFVAGSNPNPDYTVGAGVTYPWEDRTERFFPWYYSKRRPEPQGLPTTITYGGNYFNVSLSKQDLEDTPSNIKNTKAILIRTGFSTHAMNMGQRYRRFLSRLKISANSDSDRVLQLKSTYTVADDGSAVLHVSPLPKNSALFTPGPASRSFIIALSPSLKCLSSAIYYRQWCTVPWSMVNGRFRKSRSPATPGRTLLAR